MREMKDSGARWIGLVPTHWKVDKLKYHLKRNEPRNPGNCIVLSLYRELGVVPKDSRDDNHNVTSEDTSKYKYVKPGDFVINKMKAWQGSVAVSDYEGIVSPAYFVYNFTDEAFFKRYFHYLLRSCYKDEFMRLSGGIRVGQWDLPSEALDNVIVLIPSTEEQRCIAAYLDAKCAEIDALTADIQTQIDTLEQYKRSVITEVVTKGLEPDVEMKDSGVEFIGSIPAHWRITSLKRICQRIKDGSHFSPETTVDGFPYVTARDVHGKGIDYSQCRTVSEENFQNLVKTGCQPQSGDVLLVKDGATTGRVGMMTDDMPCVLLSSVAMLTPKDNVLSEYLMWLIESEVLQFQIRKSMAGSAMPRTTLTKLMAYYAIECPYQEQCMIAEYLDKECLHIDELIAKKESLIADLEIYKKSLIYEVVTGKRRVEDTNQMTIAILSPEIMRYRKALLMLRVLDLLGTGVRGRIQLQKCMFAAECLLNMPFHTQFIRYEHGPYDPDLPNIEEIINAKGWYTVLKGSPVSYQKGKQFEEGLREYMDTFSEIDLKLEKIVDFLRPMKTSQAERVATLLAAWNDFIIDGVSHPTDKEIIGEVVTNWTPNKANPQYSTWQDTLFKMREHRFVPKGSGVHTLQKEA